MGIGHRIKEARLNQKLTQEQLAKAIGVAKSTVTGYEKGNSEPSLAIMAKLMNALNVDANFIYQDSIDLPMTVSYKEVSLIKKYRMLDSKGKEFLEYVTEREFGRCNDSNDYAKEDDIIYLPHMYLPASAGTGEYVSDTDVELISVPASNEAKKANYILTINGDSMEPLYNNKDKVFVQKASFVDYGEIGIFIINNERFIKKITENGLVSLNPRYDIIKVKEYDDFKCVGKVLGKL